MSWAVSDGCHVHQLLRGRPAVQILLEHFHGAVCKGHAVEPTFEDAHRILGWLRAAEQSSRESRRVLLSKQTRETLDLRGQHRLT